MGDRLKRFETEMLPHLDAAHAYARRIMGRAEEAKDVVQEAYLRAFAAFDQYAGGSSRGWILAIVRNTAFRTLADSRRGGTMVPFEEGLTLAATREEPGWTAPDAALAAKEAERDLEALLARLPLIYREALILREIEGLSYAEIAAVTGAPLGTVMSRLSRARERLAAIIGARPEERADEM